MKISKSSITSPITMERSDKYASIFVNELIDYFKDKAYGEGVKEICYGEFIITEKARDKNLPRVVYDKNDKIITCIIHPAYRKASTISINKYGTFLAKYYLEVRNEIRDLDIKEFDTEAYLKDLEVFFKQAGLI